MRSLTVWAKDGLPPRNVGHVVLWEAFLPEDAPSDWISLPEFVHRERESLRGRYQSWLADVSQSDLHGATVAEFMSIRSNLSYWWMTLPTDNSIAVDSPAYRVLRLFALSSVGPGMKFDHVTVVTDRQDIADAVALWAGSVGKPFTIDFTGSSAGYANRQQRSRGPTLPAIRVFWNHLRIAMQQSRKVGRTATKEGIVFIDYLAHLQEPRPDGAFRSNYWGPLVELLEGSPEPVNWLHISATYATPKVVRSDVNKCEAFDAAHPAHSLLHSYLDLKTVFRAFRDYVRIRRFGKNIWKRRKVFIEAGTRLDPSPLLHELVKDQYFGRTAALNAFWISLWESTVHALPMQRLGIYLFESQPWELAFLSAWQRSHLGKTFAVAHSTMCFWDLRYFPGDIASHSWGRPIPNSVVVNGPLMKATAIGGGYPASMLEEAENLRLHTDAGSRVEATADVLVLGEYDHGIDQDIIGFAKALADTIGPGATVRYRPHPTAQLVTECIPAKWQLSHHTSVSSALQGCRIALCGASTSAALDARLADRSVVVCANPKALISSPAMDLPDVHVVMSPSEVAFLDRSSVPKALTSLELEPLHTDPEFKRWRTLMGGWEHK